MAAHISTPDFRALVVDDDPIVRRMVCFSLAQGGFACDTAEDGEHAVRLLEESTYDLLIIDLCMPKKNGHSLAVEVSAQDTHPTIIIHTSVNEPRIRKDLLRGGIDDIIYKPADYAALADHARSLVERRQQPNGPHDHTVTDPLPSPGLAVPAAGSVNRNIVQEKQVVAILTREVCRAEEIAQTIRTDRVDARILASSDELLRTAACQRIDVLVVEQRVQGALTGIDLFGSLFDQLIVPKSLLLAEVDSELKQRTERLGIDLVMSLKASMSEIEVAIAGLLALPGELRAVIPPAALSIIESCGDVPSLPQLLIRLAGYMEMSVLEIPIKDLAKDISVDPKATSELLRVTNSSAIGLSREITSVADAIKLHGAKRSISSILSSAVIGLQGDLFHNWPSQVQSWYQKRSVIMASTATVFADRLENVSADTAFILGLLQDIGCLILSRRFHDKYQSLLSRFRSVGPAQLHLMEREDLHVHHGEVSAALMLNWQLPQSMIRPVLAHHDIGAVRGCLSPAERSFARVLRIGEALANLTDLPHPCRTAALNRLMDNYGRARNADCKSAINEAIAKSAELSRTFEISIPDLTEVEQLVERAISLQEA